MLDPGAAFGLNLVVPGNVQPAADQEGEAEGAVPLAHVIRDMAGVESLHAFEGTETIQTLIVGSEFTGAGAFS